MFVWTFYRRGLWFVTTAETSAEALDALRAEKGSVWFDWQLTSKAPLSFDNLPAQKLA
jgi:hypothetical protein